MATGKQDMGLFWSCDAGYVMNDYEDDSGNIATGNKDLWYVIPESLSMSAFNWSYASFTGLIAPVRTRTPPYKRCLTTHRTPTLPP